MILQRISLLKDIYGSNQQHLLETLDIWDMQLVHYGNLIIQRRQEFVEQMNEIMDPVQMTEPGISGKEILMANDK